MFIIQVLYLHKQKTANEKDGHVFVSFNPPFVETKNVVQTV